jgi:lysyl-tRNA synthetase class II
MPKKSHRIASRQAEISKQGKRKKKSQASQKDATPSSAPAIQSTQSTETTYKSPVSPSTVSTTQPHTVSPLAQSAPAARQVAPRYQYVLADLKKIAMITGALLVILIVLTFVLH